MNAVEKVSKIIVTSVNTVSGPFHPFGGAVDIIVVQQEDGTFKSSPWYVKFGKFQGLLKRRKKKVFVAVNDGDADFHMYLDHKGEAYFLKDAQGEEVAAFSPTEASSSGDENSSHTLALEYPRVEEIANPRPELSEEEKGDDLELRFEGRDASKQLIQQSVEDRATGGLTGEEINATPGNYSGVLEIQESPRTDAEGLLGDTQAKSLEAGGKAESTKGKVMHVLLNKAIGLEAGVESTPASALVANALTSLQSPLTDDALLSPTEAVKMSTKVRRSSSNSGTIIHGLLNQALGLQPSHEAGRGLLAAAVLASLRKAVLSDSSSITPQNHVGLVELAEGSNLNLEKKHEDASSGCPVGDIKDEVPALDSSSNPNVAHSGTSKGNTSDVGMGMKTASSLGGLSESGIDQPELEVPIRNGTISPPRNPHFFDLMKTLEVRKLEILEKTLVVEVQEHVEKDRLVSVGSDCVKDIVEADGRVDSIVVDRQQVMERVYDLQGSSDTGRIPSKHAQDPKSTYEENKNYDEASKLVSVLVDKRLVKNLQEALTPKIDEGPKLNLEKEKDVSTPDMEIVVSDSENTQNVRRPEVIPTLGQELPIDSDRVPSATLEVVGGDGTTDMSTPGKDLALLKPPVNLSEASIPRMKAAIELEMTWREVVEKAATTLKGAPYATNKKFSHSLSYKKKGLENGENKKPDSPGRLPQLQSERKSWGGWLWGGSSAALQSKRTNEQGSSTDGKNAPGELSMGPLDVVNDTGLRDPSGATSELKIVTKNGTHSMHAVEGSDSNGEAEEQVAHSESDSGPTESGKAGADNWGSRENPEDHQLELGQQKSPGGPPPKRRSWIGLLSRSSTNQSSLSSASSLRSNEGDLQRVFDGLKRETSLEGAESVVDLLEESWAKGSPAHRARIRDGRIAHREQDGVAGGEVAEGSRARAASELVGDMGDVLTSADPDDGLDSHGPTHSHHHYSPDTTEPKLTVPQLIGTKEETSIPTPKCDEGTTKNRKVDADGVGGNQQEIHVTTNGSDIVTTSIPIDHASTEDTDVLLMSLDGHLVRAPVGLSNREAPLLADDKSNEVPLLSDHSVKLLKGGGNSPRKLVCFAGVPDERPDTHNFAGNGMQQTEEGTATKLSDAASDESDGHAHHDASEGKTASSGCEGLKGLAHLLENDSVGIVEQTMGGFRGLTTDSAPDQLGPHSQSAEMPKTNGRDEVDTEIDASAPEEFDDMRAMVFEKLEEQLDGDAPEDSYEGQIERFYSSKDLIEVEEEEERKATKLKRNTSLYRDAVSGEDEEDSAGSAHENDRDDWSRDRSGPIGIPGALDLAQSLSSEKGMQILRSASESLPEIRRDLVNSEMLSPRFTLSRSLDSAPSPTVLSLQTGQQTAASDGVLTAWPSNRSPVSSLGKGAVEAFVADRTPEKGKEDSEQLQGRMYKPDSQRSTAGSGSSSSSSSSNVDDGGKVPETGFELSLCRHLLKEMMGVEAAAQAFSSEKITLEEFKKSGSTIAANDKLVVRVGGRYYPWVVAAPIVLGILAFGQVLIAPNEGAIAVEQPIVAVDGQAAANTSIPFSGGGWKLWPFGRRPKTPERGAVVSREAMMVATEAALKSSLTAEYLRMAGYYKRPRKVRTNCPSSQQLVSLNLKEGSNNITFTFETRVLGKQQVDARIYLWKWNTRIVISDVDGTITKSDVLGQVMPLMGKDWTQLGVARLYSAIKKNGYELMFLSARAISQAYITRQFLENIKQDGEVLPDGPMVISPDGLFPSLYREVIRRAPHEFKIACLEVRAILENIKGRLSGVGFSSKNSYWSNSCVGMPLHVDDIKSLFHPESKPFYAGFGNRDTDELSYLKVGIPKGKIFIINPKGEVVVNNQVDVKSYTSLHKLVDDMFPAMTFTEQEDYNEWNFWKLPLPDIDDEPSVKGEFGSSSRRSVNKSGRRS